MSSARTLFSDMGVDDFQHAAVSNASAEVKGNEPSL